MNQNRIGRLLARLEARARAAAAGPDAPTAADVESGMARVVAYRRSRGLEPTAEQLSRWRARAAAITEGGRP